MGCVSETETRRVSAIKMEVKSCLVRHSASKEILPVLLQRQKARMMSQTHEHGRYTFRSLNRGEAAVTKSVSAWKLQHFSDRFNLVVVTNNRTPAVLPGISLLPLHHL